MADHNITTFQVYDVKDQAVKQSESGIKNKNQVASTSTWKPVPPPPPPWAKQTQKTKNKNQVESTSTSKPQPPWVELPEDIMAKILHKLGLVDILMSAQKVCTSWRKICRDPSMWRVIDMLNAHDIYARKKLCRLAVDLSQGHVTEISIGDFGSDDLLEYIAERCGNLRCLRFEFCYDLHLKTLSKTKGFPLLEELHLQSTSAKKDDIEAIGQSCPMLKTLALNSNYTKVMECNKKALAVATFMPELRHLQMFGNEMSNEGLEAILNGCPKLESLDIRNCSNLYLEGELGKRCAQQIKILQRPQYTIDYLEWHDEVPRWGIVGNMGCVIDFDFGDIDYDDFPDPTQFDPNSLFDEFLYPKNKGSEQSHRGIKNQVSSASTWKPVPPPRPSLARRAKQSQRKRMNKNQVASTSTWKPPPRWVELPDDIMANILQRLGLVDLLVSAQKVCTSWRKICRDPAMWRVIDMLKLDDVLDIYAREKLCRLAVDLSQGYVTEISIEDFGSDDLLEYIAERCGHLRCLRIEFCYDLHLKTLSKTKGFPLLEELHLQCTNAKKDDIEAIVQSCPMLKTFALNNSYSTVIECNMEAQAIATFMPDLRHLQMFGNEMSNEGLEAILNGCPKLESLDLQHCFNLHLDGDLGKRCDQQIKILQRPQYSIDDYKWCDRPQYSIDDYNCYGDRPRWVFFVASGRL